MTTKKDCKIVFMGTPDFAIPSLEMLIREGYNVCAVYTQPDRPKGRGHKLVAPPVKVMAEEHGIPVFQFEKISREGIESLKELAPDLIITAAFGQILSRELLAIPPLGCINVHGSLLPKYRGAAPIQWAILEGEEKSGVTTMFTKYELDAGDMLLKGEINIDPDMTGGQLYEALAFLGADVLKETLEQLLLGTLTRIPQKEEESTYYPMLERGFGRIDFSEDTARIHNFIRGLNPVPTAYGMFEGNKIKIFAARPAADMAGQPGTVLEADAKKGLFVATGDGAIEITELQWPGSKRMQAKDFLRGHAIAVGARFEEEEK